MTTSLDKEFWTSRWKDGSTGWDIGYASTPLSRYIDLLEDKNLRILIPGAGNGYEAEYAWKKGFSHVHVLDISPEPLAQFRVRVPDFPQESLIEANFFDHSGVYDLILEQTFYCALDPALRDSYVTHMAELLARDGVLAGLLFNFPLTHEGPPFGGSEEEYRQRFSRCFDIVRMDPESDSIAPRAGRELFFIACKKG